MCGKTFAQGAQLKAHKLRHPGDRQVRCDRCGRTFGSKTQLTQHLHSRSILCTKVSRAANADPSAHQHVQAVQKNYACNICFKKFSSISAVKLHRARHAKDLDQKDYACNFCLKKFPSIKAMKLHRASHAKDFDIGMVNA